MKGWHRLRCSCGARWTWWGTAQEADLHVLNFTKAHQGHHVREVRE